MAGKSLSNSNQSRLIRVGQVYNVPVNLAPVNMSPEKKAEPKKPLCPHKRTDFRYQLWLKDRKALREKAKKSRFRVDVKDPPPSGQRKGVVTIDTSKSRTNTDVVRLCLQELGWREYPFGKRDGGVCDVYWLAATFDRSIDLPGGRVNKFPGMVEVTRKTNVDRTLDIMSKLFPEEYHFHPRSWFLPQQFAEFADDARKLGEGKQQKPVYIVKPDEGSQGDGIYLITDPKDFIFNGRYHVVQEYLSEPLLLENLKFDLRIYVVLSCLEPLEIYIYNEGMARFCTEEYEPPTNKNMHKSYMHLTNYSLNKHSNTYEHTENEDDGSKRSLRSVFKRLRHKGYDVDKVWEDIRKLVVKTLIAIAPDLKVEFRSTFPLNKPTGPKPFHILGFDVLITKDMDVKLLEINSNPSLRIDFEREIAVGINEYIHSPLDEEIKRPLVAETLLLVAPKSKRRHRPSARGGGGDADDLAGSDGDAEDPEDRDCITYGNTQLTRIYPEPYACIYGELEILDRSVEIFLHCLGVRGSLRMGPTAFRNFVRRCKLSGPGGMTNAEFDIMYIDLQRRWDFVNCDRTGLCYQGFLESFLGLASRKFPSEDVLVSVEAMLDFCECNLEFGPDHKPKPGMLPKLSKHDQRMVDLKSIYGNGSARLKGDNFFIDYKNFPVDVARRRRKPLKPIPNDE